MKAVSKKEIIMGKKKEIELKTEKAIVERVGYSPSNRNTVVYVVCQGESMGKKARLNVTSGKYTNYEEVFTRELVGKELVYSYDSINDMREPVGAKFVEFVEEN